MATINTLTIQNRPLRVGFPGSNTLIIDYFFSGSGIVEGSTQLVMDYDISNNNDGVIFANGTLTHQTVIVLTSSNPPHLYDTLQFIRRGIPVNSDNIFATNVKVHLRNPESSNTVTINAFISC